MCLHTGSIGVFFFLQEICETLLSGLCKLSHEQLSFYFRPYTHTLNTYFNSIPRIAINEAWYHCISYILPLMACYKLHVSEWKHCHLPHIYTWYNSNIFRHAVLDKMEIESGLCQKTITMITDQDHGFPLSIVMLFQHHILKHVTRKQPGPTSVLWTHLYVRTWPVCLAVWSTKWSRKWYNCGIHQIPAYPVYAHMHV